MSGITYRPKSLADLADHFASLAKQASTASYKATKVGERKALAREANTWNAAADVLRASELEPAQPAPVDVAAPTVHLNGTSRKELVEQLAEGWRKTSEAMTALQNGAPHARDYYIQTNPDAYNIARAQHSDRLRRLQSIKDELNQILEKL
jgi:hypothetical protein